MTTPTESKCPVCGMIHADQWWYPYCSFEHARQAHDEGELTDLDYATILLRVVRTCNEILKGLDRN